MTTLIFEPNLYGHHLEYLHHYYYGAINRPDERYIFCVPEEDFKKQHEKYDWPTVDNILWCYLSADETNSIISKKGFNRSVAEAWMIAKKAKIMKVDRIILTNFIHTIPYLLFIVPNGVKIRGIVYRIYLHMKGKSSSLRLWLESCCFRLMSFSRAMERVYILNDQESAEKLNYVHHTDKFRFLPDPVPEVIFSEMKNLRKELLISANNKVFLLFGGLAKRKGTLEILNAIILCKNEELADKTFIFAGRVYDDIKSEFYNLLARAKLKTQILVFDEFCSYDFLYNLCYTCDIIIMPYKQTELSSGVLGYAAVFNKPIIGPNDGLLGLLINKYHLGYCLPEISPEAISASFALNVSTESSVYAKRNELSVFVNCILE